MSSIAIKSENISKSYQLGEISTGTLSRDLERGWARIRGKEDPFLKVGATNDQRIKGNGDLVWSLKDINFEIQEGETIGIVGRNGAGKSTLLKILSRVTSPTSGLISGKGRIASLLEVGTGFHPELTGRENVYLNGAILGMRKAEIKKQFDSIVDFSGVEQYIDTPVKRYSSGMYVRLAFAVAAHLESEILIVDEVLAVGDAEFQKKCLGKMGEVSDREGRTVLFVSHNIQAIKSLCKSGLYLKNGQLKKDGPIGEVVNAYAGEKEVPFSKNVEILNKGKKAWLSAFSITNANEAGELKMGHAAKVLVEVESLESLPHVFIGIGINDIYDTRLFTLYSKFTGKKFSLNPGTNSLQCVTEQLNLKPGFYNVEVFIGTDFEQYDYYSQGLQFEVIYSEKEKIMLPDSSQGSIFINQEWTKT